MKIHRLPSLLIIFAFASSALAQSIFVPARYANQVAVIDTETNQVITQIPVGSFPIRIAMTPDRDKAFISNAAAVTQPDDSNNKNISKNKNNSRTQKSSSISVLDTVAMTNIATIPVSRIPGESAITPDGGRLFVVHEAAGTGGCPVDVIDTATNTVITTIFLPGAQCKDILFTLDGRFAYVANNSADEVDVIDTTTYQVTHIPTGGPARRLCISPAGDRVYVSNNGTIGTVSVINTATQQIIATIPIGHRPMGIAITPNGQEVYVTNQQDGTVSAIDTTTLTVVATIPTGNLCQRDYITHDGTKVFVQNGYSNTVSAISTVTHTVIATLPVGNHPWTILGNSDDTKLYVCNATDTTVTVIDIPSLTVSATIANVGSAPFDVDFGP